MSRFVKHLGFTVEVYSGDQRTQQTLCTLLYCHSADTLLPFVHSTFCNSYLQP